MGWTRKRYKNGKIFVEVDAQDRMLVHNLLVRARYRNTDDSKSYSFRADAVRDLDGSVPDQIDRGAPPHPTSPSQPQQPPPALSSSPTGPLKLSDINNSSPLSALPPAGKEFIEIYTDGACTGNPGPAGLGITLRWGTFHRELYQFIGHSTNNVAELLAIKVALEAIKQPRKKIKLYTDSSYAIGVLSGSYKVKANRTLIMQIQHLMKRFPFLELIKVAGHSGHPLNDRADELARLAVTENTA